MLISETNRKDEQAIDGKTIRNSGLAAQIQLAGVDQPNLKVGNGVKLQRNIGWTLQTQKWQGLTLDPGAGLDWTAGNQGRTPGRWEKKNKTALNGNRGLAGASHWDSKRRD